MCVRDIACHSFPKVGNPKEGSGKERRERGEKGKKMCKYAQKLWSFYNLILEVTTHHFCHSLFMRIESLGPAHTHGEGITQGRRQGSLGAS